MWGSLSHGNMGPLLGICSFESDIVEVFALPRNSWLGEWRKRTNPSVSKIQQIFFEVAKAFQYIHSLGIVLGYSLYERYVYFDSDNIVTVQCPGFCPNYMCKEQFDYDGYDDSTDTLEANVRMFGVLFYKVNLERCSRLCLLTTSISDSLQYRCR
ncbi:hypothetical protein JOM56_011302 [Amanita muscaria]